MMIEDNPVSSKSKNLKLFSKVDKNYKRCMELDEKYNSMQNSPASVLSFDAYGNLTSNDDPNVSFSHDLPSMEEFDYIIEGFEASFSPQPDKTEQCQENIAILKKPSSNKKINHNSGSFEASLTHDNLKQAFKSEVNPSIGVTSRYGRTRKQKVAGDDFLVGTINFNQLRKITSPRKNKHSLENKSGLEMTATSVESAKDVLQTESKFEMIANSIPNFSSEDEFEPEKINLKQKKYKKSPKKQLQSIPVDVVKHKVKYNANNTIKKQVNKAEISSDTKIKKGKNETNNFIKEEIEIFDDSNKVKRRTSPRHKRKCENSEPGQKRNTRRSVSGVISGQTAYNSSIIEEKIELSNHLYNEDKVIFEHSQTALDRNISELGLNINMEKHNCDSVPEVLNLNEEKYLNNYKPNNNLNDDIEDDINIYNNLNDDIKHNINIINCSTNKSDSSKVNNICIVQKSCEQTIAPPVITSNDATLLQNFNVTNGPKPEIIKIETLLDEIDVKENDSLTLNKFVRSVKKREQTKNSFEEKIEKQNFLNSVISVNKEELEITDIDDIEVEKSLPFEYFVGDLVWVAVKGSPLWPGLVTNPKDSINYTKAMIGNCKNIQQVREKGVRGYHIQFLCDNFQVSWSRPAAIIPFEGLSKLALYLEKFCEELKKRCSKFFGIQIINLKTFNIIEKKIQSPKLERWYDAINEGEALLSLDRDQRLQKFLADEEAAKVKRKRSSSKPQKKSEANNNDNSKLFADEFSGFETGSSAEDLKIKRQKISAKLDDVDFHVYFKKNFHRLLKKDPDLSKYKAKKLLMSRWNELTTSQRSKYDINCVKISSSSDTSESSSEASNQSFTKLKKNSIVENELDEPSKGTYKLIRNEKVCILCESASLLVGGADMVKCKGPCCGTFHLQCVLLNNDFVGDFKCSACVSGIHKCFLCKSSEGEKMKCSVNSCGKFYHESCIKVWPQINRGRHGEKFVCPRHICHMCAANADDMNDPAAKTPPFTRCLRCPTTYHTGEICIAAGSEEISHSYHICTKHMKIPKNNSHHLNVNWCFCCSKGGSLLLCDQCPAAFHAECMNIVAPEGSYICEDCENGKFPVYGDIVWVKLGAFRWWPGQVMHPKYIPDNIENLSHVQGMFCVHFFGSDDYYWVSRGRAFHYQEGDQGSKGSGSKITEQKFQLALDTALKEYMKQNEKRKQQEESRSLKGKVKPAPWVKIDTNKPVGNVKLSKLDPSTATKCDCVPYSEAPCGSDEKCINRMLMVECIRDVCPTGDRCQNQRFQKREYPDVFPFKTSERGWGLRTKDFIKKGSFVIEYVGELIDDAEFRRRIVEMHECKEENYYFLTVETDRMIDAGPKGNLARFMNHSCEPNCETQKWTVGDETRVGLFAIDDISPDSEVTFNYNLECVGTDKKPCHCGTSRCSGFIGVKVQKSGTSGSKKLKLEKKKIKRKSKLKDTDNECFRCGNPGDLILCDKNACPKGYHLECLSLPSLPKGKWWCPWHHCDDCGNRALSRCITCPNSYCKAHSSDKFHSTAGLENVCLEHAAEEFEALRGQTETVTLQGQSNPLENIVQRRTPDKHSPEKLHPLPAVCELTKKEKDFESPIKSESLVCKKQVTHDSQKKRGWKRKYPQTENFAELNSKVKRKKIKLCVKSEMETKKRILKSLTNRVPRLPPKKVNVATAKVTSHKKPKSNSFSKSSAISE